MKMKKIISKIIVVSLILVNSFTLSSMAADIEKQSLNYNNASIYMSAEDKKGFASRMDALYESTFKSRESYMPEDEEIESLMAEVTCASGNKKAELLDELGKYGVYLYNNTNEIQPYSESGDVVLNKPSIFYSASANTWTVSCSGNWKNDNWDEQSSSGNIGGADAFGVAYTRASNYNTYVKGSSAYIKDKYSNYMKTTSSRSDGDGSKGFGFRMQDYKEGDYTYVGYRWYGSCTYDSNFANFSGIATAYYAHTYSNTNISSISFTAGSSGVGVTIGFTENRNCFKAYSSDTPF